MVRVSQAPFVREIWKRSYISTCRRTVHSNPSRKRSFSKGPSLHFKPGTFENAGFSFLSGRTFPVFVSNDVTIIVWFFIFPCPKFLTNPKWPIVFLRFQISCVFRVKKTFLRLLQHSMEVASTCCNINEFCPLKSTIQRLHWRVVCQFFCRTALEDLEPKPYISSDPICSFSNWAFSCHWPPIFLLPYAAPTLL